MGQALHAKTIGFVHPVTKEYMEFTKPAPDYFYQLIDYIGNFKRMAEARKTTMGHITQDHLKHSTIALPPNTNIANKLEERLSPIFDAIINNSQEIMNLTKQRDELLPLLMNGQVLVNYHLSDD